MVIASNGSGLRIEMDDEVTLDELVREYTMAVHRRHKCKALETAVALGISYTTVYDRLKRYRDGKRDRRTIRGREGDR